MIKKEKQLEALNKSISKGRVKSSFHFALALTTGIGIAKFLTGKGVFWLFYGAWITYFVAFAIAYAFVGKSNIRKAHQLVHELGEGEVASQPASSTGSWVAICVVAILLLSPTLFKKQIHNWALNHLENATVSVEIKEEGGSQVIKLAIPQPYLKKNMNKDLGVSFFGTEMSQINLVAMLPDMKPPPISGKKTSQLQSGQVVYYVGGASFNPRVNNKAVVLQMKNQQVVFNNELIETVLGKVIKNSRAPVTKTQEFGLDITSGELSVPNPKGKGMITADAMIGVPIEQNMKKVFIGCEGDVCAMFMEVPNIALFQVSFNAKNLKDWSDIYQKSQSLIRSFIDKK